MCFVCALFLLYYAPLGNSAEYGEYPAGISELAYFASGANWGDPNNEHRFTSIKISAGSYQTKNGTYDSLQDLLDTEDLTVYEGVAIECRECSSYDGGNELQRESQKTLEENGIKNLLFWPNDKEWSKARRIFLGRTTGKVSGQVTAAESGEPLYGVFVSSSSGGMTNVNGVYEISLINPGLERLVARRRDREDVEVEVQIVAGQTVHQDFVLPLAKPACCKLEGKWEIVLTLTDDNRPDDFKPDVVGDTASGIIVFSSKYESPFENRGSSYSDNILNEYGEYNIDLTPFFGENITASISNTVFPGNNDTDPLKQALGWISHYDQVNIDFIPLMSHGGISLSGQIVDDSEISGEWLKRDIGAMVWGTFVLKRVSGP